MLQSSRGLGAIGEDLAYVLEGEVIELMNGLALLPFFSQGMSRQMTVLVVKAVVEHPDLVEQPADMVRVLRHEGGVLGGNYQVVAREV